MAREIFTGLRNALAGRERVDTITLDDPIPGLSELWHGVLSPVRKLGRRVEGRLERTILAFLAARPTWRRLQRRKLRRRVAADPRILFVCRGNICRSPFAQAYADIRFAASGSERIQTRSAGTYPVEDRPSPSEARNASRELGIDLEAHRSRALSPSLVKWAGAILCMDERDRRELRAYPEAGGKVFFLGSFDSKIRPLTRSPTRGVGRAEEFRACYQEIVASVDGLAEALKD